MSEYQWIGFSIEDKVATLVLRRAPVNVMNMEMMEEMVHAFSSLHGNEHLNALVIRAEGKVFSAGVAVEDHLGDKTEPMIHLFHRMFHCLADVPCPTIAVVDGAALGGGCELATFCDIVLSSERAKFGQPEIYLALFPPVSIVTFPWMTGYNRTMELLLTGESISAAKAYEWGLVNRVVPPSELDGALEQLLSHLRTKSALALRLTRKTVRESMAPSFASAIKPVENIYLRELVQSADAQEGLKAFLEKRRPVWHNK